MHRNGLLQIPSSFNSGVRSSLVYSVHSTPYIDGLSDFSNSYKNCGSAIYGLLLFCYPIAVFLAVAKGVILAFQRFSFWAQPHVGYKTKQPIGPSRPFWAYRNPTPAIIFVRPVLRVGATGQHIVPSGVFWCCAQAMCLMGGFWRRFQQTPARLYSSSLNVRKSSHFWSSARADKKQGVFWPNVLDGCQKPESFFKQV